MANFWLFLTSLPTILSTMMQIEKLFIDFVGEKDRAAKRAQLAEEIKNARETKDTTRLEAFLRTLANGS